MNKKPIENTIYASVIGICERLEADKIYKGNGHHLAQKITALVSIGLLPKEKKKLYDCLTDIPQTTKEISLKTGIPSKNVSSQLKQMLENSLLITQTTNSKGKVAWLKNAV